MVNAKKLIFKITILLIILIYFSYLIYENKTRLDDGRLAIINTHKKNINNDVNITGIIIGGSNTYFSLSAEQLNDQGVIRWYNNSLLAEGYSDNNLKNNILDNFNPEQRLKIQKIIFSSVSAYRSNFIKDRSNYQGPVEGYDPIGFKPQRSMLSQLISYIKTGEKFKEKHYPEPTKTGDINFDLFDCGIPPAQELIFEHDQLDVAAENLASNVITYLNIFPNARLYVALPSEYYLENKIAPRDTYNAELIKAVEKINSAKDVNYQKRTVVLAQPVYPSSQLICDGRHHANREGRIWRTNNLIRLMQESDNLSR